MKYRPALTLVAAAMIAGCGSSSTKSVSTPTTARRAAPPTLTVPTPAPTGHHASATSVRVIRAWSNALRHGDVRAAARYFALPSRMINGTDAAGGPIVFAIHTLAQAEAVNASLPCGAVFISADQRGRYVNALFRLTDRPGPGGGCASGAGQMARTNFVIANGLIVEWIRAADEPGDNSNPAPPNPQPGPPPAPNAPSPGPVV